MDFSPPHVTQLLFRPKFPLDYPIVPLAGTRNIVKFRSEIALESPAVPCLGNLTYNNAREDGYPTRRIARFEIQRSNTLQEVFCRLLNAAGSVRFSESLTDGCVKHRMLWEGKELVNCYFWSTACYEVEKWKLRNIGRKYLDIFVVWCWRRMDEVSWTDRVRSEVLHGVKEERIYLK
jgi:hypothetical protein